MSPIRFNLVFLLGTATILTLSTVECNREIPGAIELVGYNSRKARMTGELFSESKHVTLPSEKEKADIETVKQNIEAYNKLMSVDTKQLSSQQKDMLERIVERVARLKAVLDVDATKNQTKDSVETETETTTFEMDKSTTPILSDAPTTETVSDQITTTLLPDTTVKPDQTEARSNNNLDASIGKSHTDSKYKTRQTTTPKSAVVAKTTTKRNIVHRITQKHSASSAPPSSNNAPSSAIHTHGNTMLTGAAMQQLKQHANLRNSQPSTVQETSTAKQQLNSDIAQESTGAVNVGGSLASDLIDTLANHAREDYYTKGSLNDNNNNKMKQKPTATAKPTKYHYYPHNQHIYLLPECAIQQVCNAVYVRLNYTQPLCACPSRYRDPCSASLNEDDQHTTKLIGNSKKKAITLAKTCEATTEMRECRSPKDWSLLALQNTRTGKSHYLVICRCPDHFKFEGPMAHDQPTYASVPGIRVFGMMCVRPGYSVRKPSVQPPKRYQLQKPFYMATSNQYMSNKDTRPSYQDDSYQSQHQANYQYLNRPETSSIINISNAQDFVDSISLNNFDGVYGRNNEKKGDTTAETTTATETTNATTKREKRSLATDDDPPFPWEKVVEFQNSIIWG